MPDYELAQLYQELEYRACERDPVYFLRNFCHIIHPAEGLILFDLYPSQVETLETLQSNDRVIVLKARQTGFSTLIACYALWKALFRGYQNILMLSRREKDAIKLLKKAITAYDHLPEWLKLRAGDGKSPARKDKGVEQMNFRNESVIDSLPATADTGRSETASDVILDEWAFFQDPERAWTALEPTFDIGGRCIIVSTANGFGNAFHQQWKKATEQRGSFQPLFYGWDAAPARGDAWYEAKAEDLERWQLHQEYPADPDEAFVQSARPYFDIERVKMLQPKRPRRVRIEDEGTFRDHLDGELRIWEEPDRRGAYVLGVDTAEGLPHGDFSSIHVIRVGTGEVVAHWHGRVDPDQLGRREVAYLGAYYNWALAGVERNGSGLTTLTALEDAGYKNIYYETRLNPGNPTPTKKLGWSTTKVSRPLMLDELSEAIRERSIAIWDQGTKNELLGFVRDDKGKPTGSPHDDRVFSLAIAVQMLKHADEIEYRPPSEVPFWSVKWWEEQLTGPPIHPEVVGNERVPAAYRSSRRRI